MIRVSVHLISAVSEGRSTELARMDICNDGRQSLGNAKLGTYEGTTYRGRTSGDLDKATPMRRGIVQNWPREAFHVWNLIRAMLEAAGYTKTTRSVVVREVPIAAEVAFKMAWDAARDPLLAGMSVDEAWRTYTPFFEEVGT